MKKLLAVLLFVLILPIQAMAVSPLSHPLFHAFDSNGDPLSGGLVYTYEPGTTTNKTTYSDYNLATPNANPVVLDSRGEANIYLDGTTKLVLKTSAGVTVWTLDNIQEFNSSILGYFVSDYADLATAVTAIGATETVLWIDEDEVIADTVTVTTPATLTLKLVNGASIDGTAGGGTETLTINGGIIADPGHNWIGSNLVVQGNTKTDTLYLDWAGTDDTAFGVIAAWASSMLPASTTQADGAAGYSTGTVTIQLLGKEYDWSGQIAAAEFPPNTRVRGMGRRTTRISSDYNGYVLRNRYTSGTDPYNMRTGGVEDLTIEGDRTKGSQVLLGLLRAADGTYFADIGVENSGGNGLEILECTGATFDRIHATANVGDGIVIDEGTLTWGGATTNLPTNAAQLRNSWSTQNDGAGLHITSSHHNLISGGVFQDNYKTGGANTGYNLIIDGSSRGNIIDAAWFEPGGGGNGQQAHVYYNLNNASAIAANLLRDCYYVTNAAETVDRAIIVNAGYLIVENMHGNVDDFKAFTGADGDSKAPIRVITSGTLPYVHYIGNYHTGKSVNGRMVEDQNYVDTGLKLYAYEEVRQAGIKRVGGRQIHTIDSSFDYVIEGKVTGDADSSISIKPRGIDYGDGTNPVNIFTYQRATVATTDDTTTTLASITLADTNVLSVNATVVVTDGASTVFGTYKFHGLGNHTSGSAALTGQTAISTIESAGGGALTCVFDASGNNIRIRVTGIAATNLNWYAIYDYAIY